MLDIVKEERVLEVKLFDNMRTVRLREECDRYFTVHLTKVEFGKVIDELMEIRDQMEEEI